ncbi:MAG: hypothetical protein J7L04_00330 [Bacteroidales bacterium]|nr:hypothetical protein [Bacteroidales bacterium]
MNFNNQFLRFSIFIVITLVIPITLMLPACQTNESSSQTENIQATSDSFPEILYKYFPSTMHAFIWRNWESVPLNRMAKVLNTTTENVLKAGRSMGLPPYLEPGPKFEKRGYISLIRRNWNLISYKQILILLDWTEEQLDQTLRDDDFLWVKVGGMEPKCPHLQYINPTPEISKRCAEIKILVENNFGKDLTKPQEERFAFIKYLSSFDKNYEPKITPESNKDEPLRFIYSYFAPFGDPLLQPEIDPFPDGLLQRLNKQGINGVWLHVVLHQLTSSNIFPELGKGHETRLKNLRILAKRAEKYGIKIYLYMNEPRAMPPSFFKGREDLLGFQDKDFGTLCTSVPLVRQWIKESLANVFTEVPELGGVFTITGSENLTNCWSKQQGDLCPRCSKRQAAEVIAEVNKTIADGVWQGNPNAKVIVWDWGWPDGTAWGKNQWAADIIKLLPDKVYHMSVSEWSKPLQRGGINATVGEYSISVVGPGPRAQRLWKIAKKRNLKTIAKVQVNNTWELSAIPYLPVMNLIAEHIKNLQNENVDGLMLSWSLGGYPSPNLELVKYIQDHPSSSISESLFKIATNRYGKKSAPDVIKAWNAFSSAFTEFPYGLSIYTAPMNYGPSNPLYAEPTGETATMLGFPFDDLEKWRGIYPAAVLANQFEKLANKWETGLPYFEKAIANAKMPDQKANTIEDHRFATAAWIHFKSVANQIQFIMVRDSLLSGDLEQKNLKAKIKVLKDIAQNESRLARQIYHISKEDSRIGFEASNHYYYFPLDFVEKVINCEYILNYWEDKDLN